jgi:hypothetical protein
MSSWTSSTAVFYTPTIPIDHKSVKVGDKLEMIALGREANMSYNHAIVEVKEIRGNGTFFVYILEGYMQGTSTDWTVDGINWAFNIIRDWDI